MRPLSNVELLDVWEAGLAQTAVERALSLAAAAEPDVPVDKLARLSVGRRDRLLFRLRRATFGEELPIAVTCPSCGEMAEASVGVEALLVDPAEDESPRVESNGIEIRFRLPNSLDLAALSSIESTDTAERQLLAACVLEARRGSEALDAEALPAGAVSALAARMAELDPQADVDLAMTCPACGAAWSAPFDIASFLWSEVQFWAQRLLQEVHVLARAYAWRERDILSMSARRRQAYLELNGA